MALLCSIYLDEFQEAWAHSRVGRWSTEWQGFRRASPVNEDSIKRVRTRCSSLTLIRPRALCVRLGEPANEERLASLIDAFTEGMTQRQSELLLASLIAQLADMISDLTAGSLLRFASASLWLLCDTRSRDARSSLEEPTLGTATLSHFADTTLRRSEGCDQACLGTLYHVHRALLLGLRRTRSRKVHVCAPHARRK